MSTYARIDDGTVVELFTPPSGIAIADCFHSDIAWVPCDAAPGIAVGWLATEAGGVWSFGAPPPAPAPSLAQQAAVMLAAGIQIVSTGTPALSGTYACDDAAQARINRLYSLIERHGGAFPNGLTSLPWPDASGAVHIFPSVAEFLAFETVVGDFVLTLDLIITTGAGTLPAQPVTIA